MNRGIPLTPQQFVAQWKPLPHAFDLNVWDFQVSVGQSAVDIFQKSFSRDLQVGGVAERG